MLRSMTQRWNRGEFWLIMVKISGWSSLILVNHAVSWFRKTQNDKSWMIILTLRFQITGNLYQPSLASLSGIIKYQQPSFNMLNTLTIYLLVVKSHKRLSSIFPPPPPWTIFNILNRMINRHWTSIYPSSRSITHQYSSSPMINQQINILSHHQPSFTIS